MQIGELVPDFTLPSTERSPLHLAELTEHGPVVLFFYPKAMTSGCTAESCHFRDLATEFEALGAQRVGVSADTIERQRNFTDTNGFDYPLCADVDRSVAAAYGVRRPGPLWNRRATFVISAQRRLLRAISSELSMQRHADEALEVLRAQR